MSGLYFYDTKGMKIDNLIKKFSEESIREKDLKHFKCYRDCVNEITEKDVFIDVDSYGQLIVKITDLTKDDLLLIEFNGLPIDSELYKVAHGIDYNNLAFECKGIVAECIKASW